MAPKKVKGKEGADGESAIPGRLAVKVQHMLPPHPLRRRMGHTSYIHPRSELLYLVGGCDMERLPPVMRQFDADLSLPAPSPMPLVECCDPDALLPGVVPHPKDEEGAADSKHDDEGAAAAAAAETTDNHREDSKEEEKARKSDRGEDSTTAETTATTNASDHSLVSSAAAVPNGFVWPTLAAIAVYWTDAPDSTEKEKGSEKGRRVEFIEHVSPNDESRLPSGGESAEERSRSESATRPAPREHPSIYFLGGWNGTTRVACVVGVDAQRGCVLSPMRTHAGCAAPPLTCSTVTVVGECAYVFGGNTASGASARMDVLDLRVGSLLRTVADGPPPRASHSACLLLGRFIAFFGGRRLPPAAPPPKGGKRPAKRPAETPETSAIPRVSSALCEETAVFDVVGDRWVAVRAGGGPSPRYAHAVCAIGDGEMLLHGGVDGSGAVLADAWILRLQERPEAAPAVAWVQLVPPDGDALPARCYHAMAARGRSVFMTGGTRNAERLIGEDGVCVLHVRPIEETIAVTAETRRRTVTSRDARRK